MFHRSTLARKDEIEELCKMALPQNCPSGLYSGTDLLCDIRFSFASGLRIVTNSSIALNCYNT